MPLAVRAMKAGAFDFIEKPFSDQTLLDRIRAAVAHDEVGAAGAPRAPRWWSACAC